MEFHRILGRGRSVHSPDRQESSGRKARGTALAVLLALCILSASGCRHHSNGPGAKIRIIDAVPDAEHIRVFVDQKHPIDVARFGQVSDYVDFPAGSYDVNVAADKDGTTVAYLPSVEVVSTVNHQYTGIVLGNALAWPHAHAEISEDPDASELSESQASIRVIDAFPHSAPIDLILNNIDAVHSLTFGKQSKSFIVPAGPIELKAIEGEDWSSPLSGPFPYRLSGGKSYLVVILGDDSPKQRGILLVEDN